LSARAFRLIGGLGMTFDYTGDVTVKNTKKNDEAVLH
jgi:hypothetical protein